MKAITIWQPWASAIACGIKTIEVRKWRTDYRGRILIHAGQKRDGSREAVRLAERLDALAVALPTGVVVSVGEMTDCRRLIGKDETGACCVCVGLWGFILKDMTQLYNPVRCAGNYGLWVPSKRLVDRVSKSLEESNHLGQQICPEPSTESLDSAVA